jgi:hypothetical protein
MLLGTQCSAGAVNLSSLPTSCGLFLYFSNKKLKTMALKPQCQPTAGFLFIF